MIITLEGAPAVGKSTTATFLNWHVVPEVNKLFGKKVDGRGGQDWYLRRQLDRWHRARSAELQSGFAVLDGDVFQPLWFSALFHHENWGDLETSARYFQRAVAEGHVAMPHKFVILTLNEEDRSEREIARCVASGRSIEHASAKVSRYSAFAGFQSALFGAVEQAFDGLVAFIDSSQPPDVFAAHIRALQYSTPPSASAVLDVMVEWCREYRSQRLRTGEGAT